MEKQLSFDPSASRSASLESVTAPVRVRHHVGKASTAPCSGVLAILPSYSRVARELTESSRAQLFDSFVERAEFEQARQLTEFNRVEPSWLGSARIPALPDTQSARAPELGFRRRQGATRRRRQEKIRRRSHRLSPRTSASRSPAAVHRLHLAPPPPSSSASRSPAAVLAPPPPPSRLPHRRARGRRPSFLLPATDLLKLQGNMDHRQVGQMDTQEVQSRKKSIYKVKEGPTLEDYKDDPTGLQGMKNEIFEKTVFSSSRGLLDLVTHVNKPMTVFTRQCSVSLPSGLGILPYGSKPTADSSPPDMESLIGQFLLEIVEVSSNFPFVGTIMVCDEYSSKTIYYKDNWEQAYNDFSSRRDKWVSSGNAAAAFKDKLELIGPSSAATADDEFLIVVYTPETKSEASEIRKLVRNTENISLYNKLKTYTIKTNRGRLYVTCSVLPEAMEGFVMVLLQLPSHSRDVAGAKIYGLITARIEKFHIGSTLFSKDFNEAVALEASPPDASKEGYNCMKVPLMRSILAVPLGEYLHIKGELQVCGYDAMPITIDHRIPINCENVHTPWVGNGESLSAVRMSLGSIF